MKLQGIFGKGSGKVGSSVFAVSGGEQIVREYNPKVSNPQTEAQVAQRAKLKLMSQLAAVLAPVLRFAKKGLVSPRNRFIATNIKFASFSDNQATIALPKLQLTEGVVDLPAINVASTSAGVLRVSLASNAPVSVSDLLYIVCKVTDDDKLVLYNTVLVNTYGTASSFETDINVGEGTSFLVLGYGFLGLSEDARIQFAESEFDGGDFFGRLEVLYNSVESNANITKTTGGYLQI